MVLFNYAIREITAKIVYYGPGLGGKTTNLQYIHHELDPNSRGKLISLATDTDRTLFFDFLPLDLGRIGGYRIRFQLYTVPGQVHYNATRKLVLKGVDSVIFVADAQVEMLERNRESFDNLKENLAENSYDLSKLPIVFQFNKQDLPNVATRDEVAGTMGVDLKESVVFNTVASEGTGVFESLKTIIKLTIDKLRLQFEDGQFHVPKTGIVLKPEGRKPAEEVPEVEEEPAEEAAEVEEPAEEVPAVEEEPAEEAAEVEEPAEEVPEVEEEPAEEEEEAESELTEVDLEAVLRDDGSGEEPEVEIVSLEEGDRADYYEKEITAEEAPLAAEEKTVEEEAREEVQPEPPPLPGDEEEPAVDGEAEMEAPPDEPVAEEVPGEPEEISLEASGEEAAGEVPVAPYAPPDKDVTLDTLQTELTSVKAAVATMQAGLYDLKSAADENRRLLEKMAAGFLPGAPEEKPDTASADRSGLARSGRPAPRPRRGVFSRLFGRGKKSY